MFHGKFNLVAVRYWQLPDQNDAVGGHDNTQHQSLKEHRVTVGCNHRVYLRVQHRMEIRSAKSTSKMLIYSNSRSVSSSQAR